MPIPHKAISNKKWNHLNRKTLNLMKEALRIGCVSDIIYLALYYYKNCQYDELLRYLKLAQKRLCRPYVVHYRFRDTDEE